MPICVITVWGLNLEDYGQLLFLCEELLLHNFMDHPQAAGPIKNSKQWGIGAFSLLQKFKPKNK